MKLQKQLYRHQPDQGIYGDCGRTVIACLLDLDPKDVPHEHREMSSGEQELLHNSFLEERGFIRISIPIGCETVDEALFAGNHYSCGMPYILLGTSRNGVCHVVICQRDQVIWDPSLDDSGIVGPTNGYFWLEWIVKPLQDTTAEGSA